VGKESGKILGAEGGTNVHLGEQVGSALKPPRRHSKRERLTSGSGRKPKRLKTVHPVKPLTTTNARGEGGVRETRKEEKKGETEVSSLLSKLCSSGGPK